MNPDIECYIINNYNELLKICKKYTRNDDWSYELLHEVILQLYDKKTLPQLENKDILYYIIRMITVNWTSKKSPFYHKIKRYSLEIADIKECFQYVAEEYNEDQDKLLQLLEEEYGDLDWYDKLQFQTYLLTGTLRETAEQQNSTTGKVWHNLQSTKQTIKNNILNKLNDV